MSIWKRWKLDLRDRSTTAAVIIWISIYKNSAPNVINFLQNAFSDSSHTLVSIVCINMAKSIQIINEATNLQTDMLMFKFWFSKGWLWRALLFGICHPVKWATELHRAISKKIELFTCNDLEPNTCLTTSLSRFCCKTLTFCVKQVTQRPIRIISGQLKQEYWMQMALT